MRRLSIATMVAFLAGGAIWLGWWHLPGSVTISAAGEPSEVTLRAQGDPRTVYALDVNGSGNVTGEAQIALILDGRPYKTERLDGSVNFTWGGDWYAPEAVVRYTPVSATGGSITLRYKFRSL